MDAPRFSRTTPLAALVGEQQRMSASILPSRARFSGSAPAAGVFRRE